MGVFYGTQSAFQTAISPVLSKIGNPSGSVQTKGWIDTLTGYAYMPLATSLDYDIHETFVSPCHHSRQNTSNLPQFSKSLMTERLNDAAMTAFWAYWYNTARSNTRVRLYSFFPFYHPLTSLRTGTLSSISTAASPPPSPSSAQITLPTHTATR
jgi:hypothetical protein